MARKSKVLLTTLGCVGLAGLLTVGPALAGTLTAGNSKLASELIPASTPLGIAGNVDTNWTTGIGLAFSEVVDVSIVNGAFQTIAPAALNLCANGIAVDNLANAGTTAGDTTTQFILGTTIAAGDSVVLSNAGCVAPVLTGGVQVSGGTLAGSTVDMAFAVPAVSAADATAPIFQVVNQFTAQVLPVNSVLSFVDFQETFIPAGAAPPPFTATAALSIAGIIINSDESIKPGNKVAVTPVGACTDTLPGGDGIKIAMTGDLQGLLDQKYNGIPDPFSAADITAKTSTLTLTGPQVQVCRVGGGAPPLPPAIGDRATFFTIENDGPGDGLPIVSGDRTIELTLDPTGGSFGAGNTRALLPAGTVSHTFNLDATTFFVPLIKKGNGSDTFTKLNSSSQIAGANGVTGMILSDDGTYAQCTFGTITPGTSFVINGTSWETCLTGDSKTQDLVKGTSAQVTVNAPQANVQGLTNLTQPSGDVQRVPMQILGPNRGE